MHLDLHTVTIDGEGDDDGRIFVFADEEDAQAFLTVNRLDGTDQTVRAYPKGSIPKRTIFYCASINIDRQGNIAGRRETLITKWLTEDEMPDTVDVSADEVNVGGFLPVSAVGRSITMVEEVLAEVAVKYGEASQRD